MKVWIGGEIQADIGDSFREARKTVESAINAAIGNKEYEVALDAWDCIVILRDDSNFEEITRYSKKKRHMDFRLQLNHSEFKAGNLEQRQAMIFRMLQRSLTILRDKGVSGQGLEQLMLDVSAFGKTRNWL